MATSKTKRRLAARRPVRTTTRAAAPRRRYGWIAGVAVVALAAAGAFLLAKQQAQGPNDAVAPPPSGLPETSDYHSLLIDPDDPQHVLLGTHSGLYQSRNGGRNWTFASLEGQDAMNLGQAPGRTLWTAGHEVLAKSDDGGETWTDVRPKGLPGLDIHGFAVDPRDPARLYAAVAGRGLFRSIDGGTSFTLVSKDVGGGVMALAVTADGLLAGDMEQGLLMSSDSGRNWRVVLRAQVMGLAVNPSDADRILAAGPGVLLSADGGGKWKLALPISQGAGPVAWSPSDPKIAYAVGFNRTLYRTVDGGFTWPPVS